MISQRNGLFSVKICDVTRLRTTDVGVLENQNSRAIADVWLKMLSIFQSAVLKLKKLFIDELNLTADRGFDLSKYFNYSNKKIKIILFISFQTLINNCQIIKVLMYLILCNM